MLHGPFYRCPCYVSFTWECFSCVFDSRVIKLSDFIKNILICVLKINDDLTGLEQHEGE